MNPLDTIKGAVNKIKDLVDDPFWKLIFSPLSDLLEKIADEADSPEEINTRNLAIVGIKAFETKLTELADKTETPIDDEFVNEVMEACDNLIEKYGLTPLPSPA